LSNVLRKLFVTDFKAVIKEIGRGARGARGLESARARESFLSLLSDDVDDVQLGAWWLAMRIKGETPEELAAFEAAMQETLSFHVRCDFPTIVLPCYNGARQLPNLTPLLAWVLAKRGVRVLLHGVRSDPTRVTTFELFNALQFPVARDALEAERALRERGFVFTALDSIHARLAQLISNRWRIGVRSTPHTVAKLLQPIDATHVLRVVALTHGDYIDRLGAHLQSHRANAVVFRGCEGEPVLHPKRKVDVRLFRNGESFMREWPGIESHDLPDTCDVATTVAHIREVIDGARPMPAWIDWLAQEMQLLAHDQDNDNDNENSKESKLAR
jgi:anthranilate phosphoribosyltransferase